MKNEEYQRVVAAHGMKNEEHQRVAEAHQQCSLRLDVLLQKRHLTEDEKIKEVRLKKLKFRLQMQMETLERYVRSDPHQRVERYAIVAEQITRYAYGQPVTPEEERTLKAHLRKCPSCAEFVSFVRQSRAVARATATPETSRAGCPSSEQIRRLQDVGTKRLGHPLFSKAAAEELREHILNCRWCRGEYLLLSSLVKEEIPDLLSDAEPTAENHE